MKSSIDLDKLRIEIRTMQKWEPLFKVLKEELTIKGYWHNLPRGNPSEGFKKGWGKHKKQNG
ncbi:MAG: hypothetical protein WC389_20530 [Lutibacter sp.]|jgi:hypothetical protein